MLLFLFLGSVLKVFQAAGNAAVMALLKAQRVNSVKMKTSLV